MSESADDFVLVALGSNLGDRAELIRRAFDSLQGLARSPILRSSLWQSSPVDCPPDSPLFVNAAAGFIPRPGETPHSLLRQLQFIEASFGRRRRSVVNAPRPLDLDLIAFGQRIVNSPGLTLPHPRAHTRRFVLQPLSEIASGFTLPGANQTIADLLRGLSCDEAVMRI